MILSKFPIINAQSICSDTSNYNSCFEFADIIKDKDTFRVFNIHLQTLRFSKNNKRYIDDPSITGDDGLSEPRSILEKIKKRIKDEINPNQNNVIINHNFRFN